MKLPIEGKDIAQLEIKPRFGGEFYDNITVVHKEAEGQEKKEEDKAKKKPKARKKEKPRVLSCDVGVDNLLSVFSYPDGDMFLIRGGAVKAMNQWYNKRMAELQSIYDSQGMKSGTAMTLLIMKRENFIDNELSCIAKHLVDYAIKKDIKAVVIGWNKGIKDEINIGKVNNQKFVSIPYQKLFQKIRYRCEEAGIEFELIGESHTSKCSALDREEICHHEKYIGKRVTRGMYVSAKGIRINADINGAINILRLYLRSKGKGDISSRLCRAVSTGRVRVAERTWAKPGKRRLTGQKTSLTFRKVG